MTPNDVRTDFVFQVLVQAIRLTNSGKTAAARAMGFRQDQIERLVGMPVEYLVELASCANQDLVTFSVNPDALDAAFVVLDRHREETEIANSLLRAGASYTVMHDLFGFDQTHYSEARKRLGLYADSGRPARPSPEVQTKIWQLWHSSNEAVPQRLLLVHRKTGVEIRSIWPLIQSWESGDDDPPPVDLLN